MNMLRLPRILALTALCLAAGAYAHSQPTDPTAAVSTAKQEHVWDKYTKITLNAAEREELSKLLEPFLNAQTEITVLHLQNPKPDNGTHTWLYESGDAYEFKKIGIIKATDIQELAKADYYLYSERDTLDYFMMLRLSAGDYSVEVRISPVSHDNISLDNHAGSASVYSEHFHRILMQVIGKYYSLDSRS